MDIHVITVTKLKARGERKTNIFQSVRYYYFKHSFTLGTVEEQTKYCFDVYDLNDDGFITREEMMTMMKSCMVKTGRTEEDGEEGVKVQFEKVQRKIFFTRLL